MKKTRVTITDIAKSIGMSHATVSMALKGDVRITEATRAKVGRTAKDLGYKPSRLAQGLKNGRSMLIGVVSDRSSWILGERWEGSWLSGMHDAAREAGYRLLLNLPNRGEDRTWLTRPISPEGIEEMADGMVDGVIVIGGMALSKKDMKVLQASGLPLVFAANDTPVPGHSQILSGHADRFYRIALALIDRGHKRIGVAGIAGAVVFNEIARRELARAFESRGYRFNEEGYFELATDLRTGMLSGWQVAFQAWKKQGVTALLFSYGDQVQVLDEACDQKGWALDPGIALASLGPFLAPSKRRWGRGLLWDADPVQGGRDAVALLLDRLKSGEVSTKTLDWQERSLESYWKQGEKP